jgi:hypothetical protein
VPQGKDAAAIVWLVEDVPGVPANEAWFIRRERGNILWQGASKEEGEQWAAANRVGIDFVETYEP